ncbi:hypothetical protein Prudu_1465S000700 [Prunus dulcis]|uniref:Uncharacterized protein n=1 Tax=Prunus dulcis TaxID=3755 RepID=A0A5H2Y9N9_PRUDU|nr:hypothetical protein Prudu_1465S000700 [Prunus dulcis]
MGRDVSGKLPTEKSKSPPIFRDFLPQSNTPSSKGFTGHAFSIRAGNKELFRKYRRKPNRHKNPTQAVALVETKAAAQETREGISKPPATSTHSTRRHGHHTWNRSPPWVPLEP